MGGAGGCPCSFIEGLCGLGRGWRGRESEQEGGDGLWPG